MSSESDYSFTDFGDSNDDEIIDCRGAVEKHHLQTFMLHQISQIVTDKIKSELTATTNSLAENMKILLTKAETLLAEVEKAEQQKICQLVAGKWQVFFCYAVS